MEELFLIVGEFLLELAIEVLLEVGLHSVAEPMRRQPSPWLAALGYALLGLAAGAFSLWLLPAALAPGRATQFANLLLSPIAAGFAMSELGRWRQRRGQDLVRLDRFSYGFLFAFCMALMRFLFAAH
jgi:hypothetical protein